MDSAAPPAAGAPVQPPLVKPCMSREPPLSATSETAAQLQELPVLVSEGPGLGAGNCSICPESGGLSMPCPRVWQ